MTMRVSDKTGPAFGEWLIAQAHRRDPVGHLGSEVAAIGPQVRTWGISRLRRDLDDHRAAPEAYDALDRAAQEYMFLLEGTRSRGAFFPSTTRPGDPRPSQSFACTFAPLRGRAPGCSPRGIGPPAAPGRAYPRGYLPWRVDRRRRPRPRRVWPSCAGLPSGSPTFLPAQTRLSADR